MLDTRAFFFDGMYLHSKPSKENKPQEVYDAITELESDATSKTAYFFENSTNIKRYIRIAIYYISSIILIREY